MPNTHVTVVGGGLGGLVAAVSAREAGFEVTLHESRRELGGRARTTPGPHRANWGPHVVYADGALWSWLDERGLARPAHRAPALPRMAFRFDGRAHLLPPAVALADAVRLRRADAPVDRPFVDWAEEVVGNRAAASRLANLMGAATFDHDPGRLSAAFVNERLRRVTQYPPAVRYFPGGWATMISRLADHARRIGVAIETSSPVDRLPAPPAILAVPLPRAADLLGEADLRYTGTRTALLDVGLEWRRLDPFILSDLDASGWVETFSQVDPSLAPKGEQLVQSQVGLRPGESLDEGVARIEALLDLAFPRWRERETWRRRMAVEDESGALDLPGTTWRDRPAGDRGDGVHLVGDMVAAPGLLGEVSFNSAVEAVRRLSGDRGRLVRVA